MSMELSQYRVAVTGGSGFLGSNLCAQLRKKGCGHLIVPRRTEFDFTEQESTRRWFEETQPEIVFHLAAEVGGIGANQRYPGRFFYANMAMGVHLMEEARRAGVKKFIQVGTVCAYPKFTPVPFREEDLWEGYPEETNAPYGIAKKALLVMAQAYRREYGFDVIYLLPVNLYGPGDNFDLESSHVIPALIRKILEAKKRGECKVTCWGTGSASREFLYVEDCARGLLLAAECYSSEKPINLGSGQEVRIRDLAQMIADLCDFKGELEWDSSRPDGQRRRCLDVQRAKKELGFAAQVLLEEGLVRTIEWYRKRHNV